MLVGTSKIAVDLIARSFEIEVPDERVEEVLSRLEELFRIPIPNARLRAPEEEAVHSGDETHEISDTDINEESKSPSKKRRGNGKGAAKDRAFQLVELGLTPEQRADVRKDFEQRAPKGQNEQVAVLAVKLESILNKSDFTGDQMHSAFKIVDKPTPKNLMAVFGNMKRDGRANYSDNKLLVNSHTQDYVNYHMGKAPKSKS